jgi:hypothetical protein
MAFIFSPSLKFLEKKYCSIIENELKLAEMLEDILELMEVSISQLW